MDSKANILVLGTSGAGKSTLINAIVAGAIIAGIGQAATIIMEKAYLGEINKEDFEWINRVVEDQMGTIVKTITKFTSEHMGSINITDIIKAILSKQK